MKPVLISLLLVISTALYAQETSRSFKDRIYFGGGGGFNGGSINGIPYFTISVSPIIGYKITDRISSGLQLTYQYFRVGGIPYNSYGGGPFARFNITRKLFTYTQYEILNFPIASTESDRAYFQSWFVGLGYSEPIGKNAAFNITALYNLLWRDGANSPYGSPIQFRVGIVAGLFN